MGASQRRKGASYEREVAKKITAALGFEFKRRLGQAREGGHDLTTVVPLISECKRRKRPIGALAWLEQAAAACTLPEHIPVVFTRGDNSEDVTVLYMRDFLTIYNKALLWDMIHGEGDE